MDIRPEDLYHVLSNQAMKLSEVKGRLYELKGYAQPPTPLHENASAHYISVADVRSNLDTLIAREHVKEIARKPDTEWDRQNHLGLRSYLLTEEGLAYQKELRRKR